MKHGAPMNNMHMKYMDDVTLVESINLKKLVPHNRNLCKPVEYHRRTGHHLPENGFKTAEKLRDPGIFNPK